MLKKKPFVRGGGGRIKFDIIISPLIDSLIKFILCRNIEMKKLLFLFMSLNLFSVLITICLILRGRQAQCFWARGLRPP